MSAQDAWLVEVAEGAGRDAGGVPVGLLGDYLPLLADAAVSGRRPKRSELEAVGRLGRQAAEQGIRVSPLWLVATYFLHTCGELCLSPVGLSAMTKLAPARIVGLTMGVWFVALSAGNYLGGRVAGLYEAFSLPQLFGAVAAFAALAAVVLALLVRPIRRMLER